MIIDSMRQDLLYYKWVVILKEKSAERYLPIYVGAPQGEIIKGLLEGTAPFRAMYQYVIDNHVLQ